MGRAIIHYKKNDVRLTAVNFITGAFLYMYLAGELIGGKNIVSDRARNILIALLAGEIALCAGSIIVAFYQRQYNRRLAETNSGINRWYFSERTFDFLSATVMILIGGYFFNCALTETHSGLAIGGLFFDNQRFDKNAGAFWQLIYFHFALSFLPFVGAAWLLIFAPKEIRLIEPKLNYNDKF